MAGLLVYYQPLQFTTKFSFVIIGQTDHVVRARAGTICQKNALGQLSDDSARSAEVAHQRQPSPTVFLDKMKRIYRSMVILVRIA